MGFIATHFKQVETIEIVEKMRRSFIMKKINVDVLDEHMELLKKLVEDNKRYGKEESLEYTSSMYLAQMIEEKAKIRGII